MNEQIRELMAKAGIDVERLRMHPGGFPREDLLVLEDFAQLIVKECAGIYSKIDNGNLHMGTDDYLEALDKTFFGVEE